MKFEDAELKELKQELDSSILETIIKQYPFISSDMVRVRCNVDGFDAETRLHFRIDLEIPDDIWLSIAKMSKDPVTSSPDGEAVIK